MKSMRTLILAACIFSLGALLSPKADASAWNQKTILTFEQPVQLPGVVLPAGTYVFKLLKSQVDRHVVRVLSQDGRTVFATINAIPSFRTNAPDRTLIVFEDRPAGEPRAIKEWFSPGRNYGHEFVYSTKEPVRLAKADEIESTGRSAAEPASAPTIRDESTIFEPSSPALSDDSSYLQLLQQRQSGETDSAMNYSEPIPQSESTDYYHLVEQMVPSQLARSDEPEAETTTEMPQTASYLPLVGLSGVLLLGAGVGLRLYSRRVS